MSIDGAEMARPAAGRRWRLAIVLHGRMGGSGSLLQGAPPKPLRSLDGAMPSVTSAALCAASLERHIIAPNRGRADMDVFGHSWSPEIGATLDALFALRRSVHQQGLPLRGFHCPESGFAHHYCHRTVSHLLGITRAMRLKRAEELERAFTYDAVFLSRWDVLWQAPLLNLRELSGWHAQRERRARTFWLPRICAPVDQPGGSLGNAFRTSVCGGGSTPWLATQAAVECSPAARACQHDMRPEARELLVMDWWLLIGTSSDADEFAEGVSGQFGGHARRIIERLSAHKRGAVAMGHAWFGAQLVWAMNATLRHVGNIGVDFHLGRAWNEFDCLALRPACDRRTCRATDLINIRPWHPQTVRWPSGPTANLSLPPPITLPDPASPMSFSCEQRYFKCLRFSKMCVEADRQHPHPMDRVSRKALFLGCAERLCVPSAGAQAVVGTPQHPMNSTECAGALLQMWLHVSRAESSSGASREAHRGVHADWADASLRRRASAGTPVLDPTCTEAWRRSNGGERLPTFKYVNVSSSLR
jgi:hypothetical protein